MEFIVGDGQVQYSVSKAGYPSVGGTVQVGGDLVWRVTLGEGIVSQPPSAAVSQSPPSLSPGTPQTWVCYAELGPQRGPLYAGEEVAALLVMRLDGRIVAQGMISGRGVARGQISARIDPSQYDRLLNCKVTGIFRGDGFRWEKTVVIPGTCAPEIEAIRFQYVQRDLSFWPSCSQFTNEVPVPSSYTFNNWKSKSGENYAILDPFMVSNIECAIGYFGSVPGFSEGYRTPNYNATFTSPAWNSRHLYGDAVDLIVNTKATWDRFLVSVLEPACNPERVEEPLPWHRPACVEPWEDDPDGHIHVDYRPHLNCSARWRR